MSSVCRHCGDPLAVEAGLLVSAVSGDLGGSYDVCEASPDGLHHPTPTPRMPNDTK